MMDPVTVLKGQDWLTQIQEEKKRIFEHGI